MRLQVKGKNLEVSDSIREYAEQKIGKLERHLNDPTRVEVELAVERNPSISDNQVAEATVWTKGPVLRARESSKDMKASIDQLADKLQRQVKRYRQKRSRRGTRQERDRPLGVPIGGDGTEPMIVKSKQFPMRALDDSTGNELSPNAEK